MSSFGRFTWIEMENFRGFKARKRFEIDASAVLVYGQNGTGKTSFFDAFQWLILGTLTRLADLKTRRNDDYLSSRYTTNDTATVRAGFLVDGEVFELHRQGPIDPKKQRLTLKGPTETTTDAAAEASLRVLLTGKDDGDLVRLLFTSGLMQQDGGRHILEEKASERYRQLTAQLGLDTISGFAVAARERHKALEQRAVTARADLARATTGLAERVERRQRLEHERRLDADVVAGREQVAQGIRSLEPGITVADIPADDAQAALLQESARALGVDLKALIEEGATLDESERALASVSAAEVERLEAAVSSAGDILAAANAQVARVGQEKEAAAARSSQMASLAAQALQLLGPQCPVCRQDIATHDVEAHLQAVLSGGPNAELAELSKKESEAKRTAAAAAVVHVEAESTLAPLKADYARLRHAKQQRDAWLVALQQFGLRQSGGIELQRLREIHARDSAAMTATLGALRTLYRLAGELRAVLQSGATHDQLLQADRDVTVAQRTHDEHSASTTLANREAERGKTLRDAALRATAGVIETRFRELKPLISDIYSRLDPHPTFRDMGLEVGVYNGQPILVPVARDESADVDADPLLHFSSAQANVAALSYFLALGWASDAGSIPFLLLDDPVQSMDDINLLGFADLCRHVRSRRQLFVSTHDRRLALLLERKLAPRDEVEQTLKLTFDGWTMEGPHVTQRFTEPQVREGRSRSVIGEAAA